MKVHKLSTLFIATALVLSMVGTMNVSAAPLQDNGSTSRQLTNRGTTTFSPAAEGSGALANPEFPGIEESEGVAAPPPVNRSFARGHKAKKRANLSAPVVSGNSIVDSGAKTSFDGLNFRQQRTANGGNQFDIGGESYAAASLLRRCHIFAVACTAELRTV